MMRKIIMAALLMLFSLAGWAQQIVVKGQVIGTDINQPIEFANAVLQTTDSVFITGNTTDEKGIFKIEKVKPGDYLVAVSSLGYKTTVVAVSGLSGNLDLGKILLDPISVVLNEVTVSASAIRNRADRRIAFPTDKQKANSTNGINLLSTLMLPQLEVNPLTNEVKLTGEGNVQFCINGIKVNQEDVRALSPQMILRVEYHDNPGLRYGNAAVVIDYITRRESIGGSINLDVSNSPVVAFGDDQISFRLNHKKSEIGFQYGVRYRSVYDLWGDLTEVYHLENKRTLKRISEGIPAHSSEQNHNFSLNYSLVEPDKYYFNATLRHSITDSDKKRKNHMYQADEPQQTSFVCNPRTNNIQLPSLDLYYLRNLPRKQTLIFNIVGTYIRTNAHQFYKESVEKEILTDILSDVKGKKYSLIGEGIYEKAFVSGRLSGGMKHIQSWTDNAYTGTVASNTNMNQSETYVFTEYSGKFKKFRYTGGVGVSRSWFRQEGEKEYTYYTFRPKVTLQYNFTNEMFFRLRGSIDNSSPGLSDLSAVDQYIDSLQIRRGNPLLKPYKNYNASMNYEYKKNIFTGSLNFYYRNSPDIIMEETLLENDKFIRTQANQIGWQKISGDVTVKAGPLKNILQLSLTGGMNRYISEGNFYKHTYTNWYYRASVMAMYKKFMALFQIQSCYNNFVGETLLGGENIHLFMLRYNQGKFTAGAGIMLPFSSQYKRTDQNRNALASYTSEGYSNDFSRLLLLTFSWNFDFGRKFKAGNKKLYNSDTDAGILTTGK